MMMKNKHKRIRVKFSHMKTCHNGVDDDWGCIFKGLESFNHTPRVIGGGRTKKAPIFCCIECDKDIWRQICTHLTYRIDSFHHTLVRIVRCRIARTKLIPLYVFGTSHVYISCIFRVCLEYITGKSLLYL